MQVIHKYTLGDAALYQVGITLDEKARKPPSIESLPLVILPGILIWCAWESGELHGENRNTKDHANTGKYNTIFFQFFILFPLTELFEVSPIWSLQLQSLYVITGGSVGNIKKKTILLSIFPLF